MPDVFEILGADHSELMELLAELEAASQAGGPAPRSTLSPLGCRTR